MHRKLTGKDCIMVSLSTRCNNIVQMYEMYYNRFVVFENVITAAYICQKYVTNLNDMNTEMEQKRSNLNPTQVIFYVHFNCESLTCSVFR